ncbi:MAG: DUF3486 family protein [Burkholderiales bacterium]|nr:DUF3486 family protein [Burkholderiales bacterium]
MPRPRKIDLLPEAVRKELEQALISRGFSGYEALAEWLQSQGYEIKKSAVHEWGQDFKDRLSAIRMVTQQARAIVEAEPDDDNALSDALIRLTQERAFKVLMEANIDPSKVNFAALTRNIAQLTRASVTAKKHAAEVREKIAAKFAAMESEAKAGGKEKRAGFDLETLKRVREEIYGIVS